MKNKISVITPSYNSSKYIERAIKSVLQQDYTNWEHIVIDGGSNDGTTDILKKYPHITWVSEADNGQADAMNKGFRMSQGDIIVYLNADDAFDTDVFTSVVNAFTNDTDIVVGNGTMVINNKAAKWNSETSYHKCLLHFKYSFPYNPVSYFYKSKVQEAAEGFNVSNKYTMDYEFILYAFQHFTVKKVEKNFGFFYLDGTNKTSLIDPVIECRKTAIRHCLNNDVKGLFFYLYNYSRFFMFRKKRKKLDRLFIKIKSKSVIF